MSILLIELVGEIYTFQFWIAIKNIVYNNYEDIYEIRLIDLFHRSNISIKLISNVHSHLRSILGILNYSTSQIINSHNLWNMININSISSFIVILYRLYNYCVTIAFILWPYIWYQLISNMNNRCKDSLPCSGDLLICNWYELIWHSKTKKTLIRWRLETQEAYTSNSKRTKKSCPN